MKNKFRMQIYDHHGKVTCDRSFPEMEWVLVERTDKETRVLFVCDPLPVILFPGDKVRFLTEK